MKNTIKEWRERQGLKAVEAAVAVEVTPAMWSRWENGTRPIPAERVPHLSRITGIPRHELRPDLYEAAQ